MRISYFFIYFLIFLLTVSAIAMILFYSEQCYFRMNFILSLICLRSNSKYVMIIGRLQIGPGQTYPTRNNNGFNRSRVGLSPDRYSTGPGLAQTVSPEVCPARSNSPVRYSTGSGLTQPARQFFFICMYRKWVGLTNPKNRPDPFLQYMYIFSATVPVRA